MANPLCGDAARVREEPAPPAHATCCRPPLAFCGNAGRTSPLRKPRTFLTIAVAFPPAPDARLQRRQSDGQIGSARRQFRIGAASLGIGEERDEWRVLARSCFDSAGGVLGFPYWPVPAAGLRLIRNSLERGRADPQI